MFEASRSSSSSLPILAGAAILVAIGLWWWSASPASSPAAASHPAPAPAAAAAPRLAGTADEAYAHLDAVLDELPGGRLYHLDCVPAPCVATVRMPLPKGADASWRNRFEAALTERGWSLSPPGTVHVLDPREVDDGVLPERALYTLALRGSGDPLDEEARAEVKARIAKQAGDATFAFGPW